VNADRAPQLKAAVGRFFNPDNSKQECK